MITCILFHYILSVKLVIVEIFQEFIGPTGMVLILKHRQFYLKTTTASVLDPALTFTQYVSGATQVNTGTIGTSSAANSLSFSTTSFPYDGSQNLLVIVKSVRSSGSNNDPQVQYNTSNSRHIQWVASGSDPSGNTGTLTNNRPNFGFDMTSAKALACADGNCYCIPTYTNVGDKLNSFTTTGGSNNINDADNTTGTYKNKYSTQYVEVAAGSTFDFSSPITGQNTNFYIWIDWNKNNIFEASEVVFSQYKSGNGLSFSGTINVPSGQANGNYRMRVRTAYTGGVSGTVYPCNNYDYGQARDYKVVVVNPTCSGKPTGGTLSISPAVGTPTPMLTEQLVVTRLMNPEFHTGGNLQATELLGILLLDRQVLICR